jgi:hypothetical protein
MKIKLLLITALVACFGASVQAQSETYFAEGGICYGVLPGTGSSVEVAPYYYALSQDYSGNVVIPDSVTHDGTTYTVTRLANEAFAYSSLSSVSLPSTLNSIGDLCFLYTTGITTLHLPSAVQYIGEYALCASNLAGITVDSVNPYFCSIGGRLYSKDSSILWVVPCATTGSLSIPSFVLHIQNAACFNCQITSVVLPAGLRSIGRRAFGGTRISNITIPASVVQISGSPFQGCTALTGITIAEGNTHYVADGTLIYSAARDTLISAHRSNDSVILPSTLKVLGGFASNKLIKYVKIPESVTVILEGAFFSCTFTKITLPHRLHLIGEGAFAYNSNLVRITMPEILDSMGNAAFAWCTKLNTINIPDSLRVIPTEAFNSCPALRTINWGNQVEEIGNAAFWAVPVTNLVLPPTLRKMGDYVFSGCTSSLHSVTFTGVLDSIGEQVFEGANLRRIKFVNDIPPATRGVGCLNNVANVDSIIIACGSTENYTSDSYWSAFASKYHEDCNSINETNTSAAVVTTDKLTVLVYNAETLPITIYDIMGHRLYDEEGNGDNMRRFQMPSTGVYIVKTGNISHKVVVK